MSVKNSKLIFWILGVLASLGLVTVACVGFGFLGLVYVQAQREAARREQCRDNLKQLGLALHNSNLPLSKADAKLHADIIGRWTEELPDGAEAIKSTIYRKDGKLYLERDSDDSDAQTIELVETASPTGVRYDHVPQSETGDYLLIDEAGGLQTWNETGLVSTAMKK